MSQMFAAASYNTHNAIWCLIEGDDIFQTDLTGARVHIGKTIQEYNTLKATTNEYYEELVKLGVFKKVKTQEEFAEEFEKSMQNMNDTVLELAKIVQGLQEKVGAKENESHNDSQHAGKNVSECKNRTGSKSS